MTINDPWYKVLEERYGTDFCVKAGYFDETKPWNDAKYGDYHDLPSGKTVLQYSGAFHPFHEGHASVIKGAINEYNYKTDGCFDLNEIVVAVHVDHSEYRNSKGEYSEEKVQAALEALDNLYWYDEKINCVAVFEDRMPGGCSRNFTRLYAELSATNYHVIFLSGGDRANYALTFIDDGGCFIIGRDQSEMYNKYKYLAHKNNGGIRFQGGHLDISSSAIRAG